MLIRHVSDTALWVAMYRAIESERADALIHDPHARRLAGERGAAIVRAIPFGESMAWAMVVRTVLIDEIVLRCIADGARSVINLGAGLDTRAWRLALPADLEWIDVDLPAMVAYRVAGLAGHRTACRHRHIAADLADPAARREMFAAASRGGGPQLVLTEGLLVYLAEPDVAALACEWHAQPHARWWIADLVTPSLLALLDGGWQSQLGAAPFRFAPADAPAFFEPLGWREAEFRSIWDEAIRLRRAIPGAGWWNAFARAALPGAHSSLRRMSGVALLERTAEPSRSGQTPISLKTSRAPRKLSIAAGTPQ